MIKKITAILMLCIVLSWLGCSQKKQQPLNQVTVRKKLSLVHYFSGNLSGGIQDVIKSFNNSSTEYELSATALDHEAFKTSIVTEISKSNPPDIYSYWAGARVHSVAEKLEPLDKIWDSTGLAENFSQPIINSAITYNGKKYLLPITQHFVGFFYNKAIFEELKLQEPHSWSQFLEICTILKQKKIQPLALGARNKWPAQFWFDYLLLRTAPYDYRNSLMNGSAHYTDPQVAVVFKLWSDLLNKGFFNKNADEQDWDSGAAEDVYQGKAAMTLMGTWLISYFSDEKHKWEGDKDFGFFPFPVIDEKIPLTALGPIDGFVIPANSHNKAGAMQVIAHLAGIENQKIMSKGAASFAPSTKVPRDFYSKFQQTILQDIEDCQNWAFNYDLATPPSYADLGLNSFCEFIEFPSYGKKIFTKLEQQIQLLKQAPSVK